MQIACKVARGTGLIVTLTTGVVSAGETTGRAGSRGAAEITARAKTSMEPVRLFGGVARRL